MKDYYFGLFWDRYTPAVEGQIVRDVIALQNMPKRNLIACVPDGMANQILGTLGIPIADDHSLATLWITYRTGEDYVEPPPQATTVIKRDLYQPPAYLGIDTTEKPGYYLSPQGRPGQPTTMLNRPAPNHSGITDPIVLYLWG